MTRRCRVRRTGPRWCRDRVSDQGIEHFQARADAVAQHQRHPGTRADFHPDLLAQRGDVAVRSPGGWPSVSIAAAGVSARARSCPERVPSGAFRRRPATDGAFFLLAAALAEPGRKVWPPGVVCAPRPLQTRRSGRIRRRAHMVASLDFRGG